MKIKSAFSLVVLGISLVSCQMMVGPQSSTSEISTGLTVQIDATGPRAIVVDQWDVTSLDLFITGKVEKTLSWKPGDTSALVVALPVGSYQIRVVHHGISDGKATKAEESASFTIVAGKVTVLKVTPGGFGTVEVGPTGADNPSGDTGTIEELRSSMVGTWKGTMVCPWIDPIDVTFVFRADGTYSSYSSSGLSALYYGSNSDSPLKVWEVYDRTNSEMNFGLGRITIYFEGSETTVVNELNEILVQGNSLSFRFKHFGQYGPIVYQLTRDE